MSRDLESRSFNCHTTGAIEGDAGPVELYIKKVGCITRAVTADESRVLSTDNCTIDQGQTLVHLALRYSNHNVAVVLLSHQQQVVNTQSYKVIHGYIVLTIILRNRF